MSALALDRKIVVNEAGDPVEVIIPYDQYVDFIETYGLDLTEEEKEELREARADVANKNRDAFVSLDEVKKGLGLEECTN
ncbi:MAG: hypothetical protein P1U86_22940 [Verrucomicrobiales bacterium]|nr:hypothetical protein [Verrucomicrobiales bacterium]